jgi:hypothetical protein
MQDRETQKQIEQYDWLMDSVGDTLNGKKIEVVIPVLTSLLANSGVMSGITMEAFIQYVVGRIVKTYIESDHDGETVH